MLPRALQQWNLGRTGEFPLATHNFLPNIALPHTLQVMMYHYYYLPRKASLQLSARMPRSPACMLPLY